MKKETFEAIHRDWDKNIEFAVKFKQKFDQGDNYPGLEVNLLKSMRGEYGLKIFPVIVWNGYEHRYANPIDPNRSHAEFVEEFKNVFNNLWAKAKNELGERIALPKETKNYSEMWYNK